MKTIRNYPANSSVRRKIPFAKRRSYWTAIWLASLACAGVAGAQSTNAPSSAGSTNAPSSGSSTNVTKLQETTVLGNLDAARNQIVPDLGATTHTIAKEQIEALPLGENATFNEVLLQMPGMAEDSEVNGDLHLRGEHANIQYRINDVLIPEALSGGFGAEIGTRYVESVKLITGSLPAEYGFRTSGVVDIQTKSGAFDPGGDASIYGGSFDTISPSFSYGGSQGKLNYFVDGSFFHSGIGIENTTNSYSPIHDMTDQYKGFVFLSYILDDTSRLTAILSSTYGTFQVPNSSGLPQTTQPNGASWSSSGNYTSTDLNDNQLEENNFAVISYQKSVDDFNLQLSGYGRESAAHYIPDNINADLDYNSGVASDENRILYSGGYQADASYNLGDKHTLRGGTSFQEEYVSAHSDTTVFPIDPATGDATSTTPMSIVQQNATRAQFYGFYLQDEWKLLPKLTFNYGTRFDIYSSSFDHETQLCPRASLVYEAFEATTLHAGYAHYFTPPPLENVPAGNLTAFNSPTPTSGGNGVVNAAGNVLNSPAQAERSDYFDAGITQKLPVPGLQVGVDGYYKRAKNQLDDGAFGQSLIVSSFNYSQGRVEGIEFTVNYATNGFSSYANIALSQAQGRDVVSGQFLFDSSSSTTPSNPYAALNYIKNNWIYLDHDQFLTCSFGASYRWMETSKCSTLFLANSILGSGLRTDGAPLPAYDGVPTPNGGSVGEYFTVNLGVEQDFKLSTKQMLKARVDVENVTDQIYQLRSGSGVGVNYPQYGERRAVFCSLTYVF